jgi:hypothetical protein
MASEAEIDVKGQKVLPWDVYGAGSKAGGRVLNEVPSNLVSG